MKQKFLILFLLGGLVLVWGCPKTPTPTNGKTFTIEYDHQVSWTCFPWGLGRPETAFGKAGTVLETIYDQTTLTDSLIRFLDRFKYHDDHRLLGPDSNALYPGYICGIKAFTDTSGAIMDTMSGRTYPAGAYHGWSFVCGWVAYSWSYRDKVAIHELGHQRANLSHLCLSSGEMNPDHNADDCVMGEGEVASCTGQDLTNNPEFCGNCCTAIKGVNW